MDKRKKRTSINQYLMYIELLEKDETFRTGTAPRDAEPNCMNNKWKELSLRLNTCQNGPQLSPEEWKKRLNDWKNSTRCKYRRSISGEKDISMSPLEKKALSLFGKTPVIMKPSQAFEFKSEARELYEAEKKHQEEAKTKEKRKKRESFEDSTEGIYIDDDDYQDDASVEEIEVTDPKPNETMNGSVSKSKRRRTIETSLPEVTLQPRTIVSPPNMGFDIVSVKSLNPKEVVATAIQTLSKASADSSNNIATVAPTAEPLPSTESPFNSLRNEINMDVFKDVALQLKRIADIKSAKLRFEIAKHKFNNPGFDYPSEAL